MTRVKILAAACLGLGCGVSAGTVNALQADVNRERQELQAAKSTLVPLDAYNKGLRGNTFHAPYSFVYLGPQDLVRAISAWLPYRIPARDLLGDATGEIEVLSVSQPRLQSRNRIRLQLTFVGKNVKVRNVPSAFAAEVKRAMDGLAAGAVAEIEATVLYTPGNRVASVRPECLSVNLKRNNDPSYRSQMLDTINKRLLDRAVPVSIPPLNGQPAEALFLTGDHVVIQYRQ